MTISLTPKPPFKRDGDWSMETSSCELRMSMRNSAATGGSLNYSCSVRWQQL